MLRVIAVAWAMSLLFAAADATATADGATISETGVFTSIWRWRDDGTWQIVFDAGCPPCADAPSDDE